MRGGDEGREGAKREGDEREGSRYKEDERGKKLIYVTVHAKTYHKPAKLISGGEI